MGEKRKEKEEEEEEDMPILLPYKLTQRKLILADQKATDIKRRKREREITAVNSSSERYLLQPLSHSGNL